MQTINFTIATNPNPNPQNQQPTTITWESVGVISGTLISLSVLVGLIIKATSNFNRIDSKIQSLEEDLAFHIKSAGHEKVLVEVESLEKQFNNHDKLFAIHLQDFVNSKEYTHYLVGGVAEGVKHCREAGKAELKEVAIEIKEVEHELKELQKYLQKHETFVIRENEK